MLQEDIDPKELQKAKIEIPKLIEQQKKEKKPDDDKVVGIKSSGRNNLPNAIISLYARCSASSSLDTLCRFILANA